MEWTLELVLAGLLLATLLQAIRLERALGGMKRDRATLESLMTGFTASAAQAEHGIQNLRAAADGAGRQIETQINRSAALKEELGFLIDRAERLIEQLDSSGRVPAHPMAQRPATAEPARAVASQASLSQAELELLAALRMPR